jgi:hypothetical protein
MQETLFILKPFFNYMFVLPPFKNDKYEFTGGILYKRSKKNYNETKVENLI